MLNFLSPGLLLTLCLATPAAAAMGGDLLYTVSPSDNNLRVVDPLTGTTISSVAMVASGVGVLAANGLAVHPTTGELWTILQLQSRPARWLAKVNPTTGVATVIGSTGDNFAGLAFDAAGTLYGVTGDGAARPETLFTMSMSTGSPTLFMALGNGTEGETIAYHPTTGLMYHASGANTQNVTQILETIDLPRQVVTNVPMSGYNYVEALAMTWWVGDNFLVVDLINEFFVVTSTGLVSRLGSLDHAVKGMAFVPRSGAHFDLYGNGFPATGGYVPVLAGSGTPSPSSTIKTGIVNGPGGAPGVLLMGLAQGTLQISPICVLQNMPILPFVTSVALTGTGSGQGTMSLSLQIPPGTLPGDIFFQVVLFEGLTPFTTNPLQIHVQ